MLLSGLRSSLVAALLCCTALATASAQEAAEKPAAAVETAAVKLAPVTREGNFVGTVNAVQQVDLMARVEGFLDSVDFQEGGYVQAGSLAFGIEKDTYQAALDGAQATLQAAQATLVGAEANLKQAQVTLDRQVALFKTKDVPQSTVDQATATRDTASASVGQAQAQIAQAQAQVKTAQLNLSYTDVKTPISGRIGKAQVTVGNLVSPSSGKLATVVQVDPIRVVFSISDREYLQVVDALKPNAQGLAGDAKNYQPRLKLSDGTDYDSPGKIAFIDNTIDPTTGTIAVYAEFANPRLQLVPGQYVPVIVQAGQPVELPVVPAAAVLQDQNGAYVFVLGDGNRAVIRRVTLGARVGVDWSVQSGLASGEIIIVSGIQKVQAGVAVNPTPAKTGN